MRYLVLLLPLLAGLAQCSNTKECNAQKDQFNKCTEAARQTYVDAMKKEKEGDGRAHYKARKVCTYMQEGVEICGNKLCENNCNTEEQVNNRKDIQIRKMLKHIGTTVENFDSCKCPVVKSHLNRMQAAKGGKVVKCPGDNDDDLPIPASCSPLNLRTYNPTTARASTYIHYGVTYTDATSTPTTTYTTSTTTYTTPTDVTSTSKTPTNGPSTDMTPTAGAPTDKTPTAGASTDEMKTPTTNGASDMLFSILLLPLLGLLNRVC